MADLMMLDMREAGKLMGLSAASVKRLVRSGKLKARWHENRYVTTLSDIEKYISSLRPVVPSTK